MGNYINQRDHTIKLPINREDVELIGVPIEELSQALSGDINLIREDMYIKALLEARERPGDDTSQKLRQLDVMHERCAYMRELIDTVLYDRLQDFFLSWVEMMKDLVRIYRTSSNIQKTIYMFNQLNSMSDLIGVDLLSRYNTNSEAKIFEGSITVMIYIPGMGSANIKKFVVEGPEKITPSA